MCIILFSLSQEIGETYATHPARRSNGLWTSRHVTKKSNDGLKQAINSLEKDIVSDFASHMLPETLNGIEFSNFPCIV
jgi:hypothetical protein